MGKFFYIFCVFSSCVLALEDQNVVGSGVVDECAPVVTAQDMQNLNRIAAHPTDYLIPGTRLTEQDIQAVQHLVEESEICGRKLISQIPEADSLLYVLELRASVDGPFSPADVNMLRQQILGDSGLTSPQKVALTSPLPQNLSGTDRLALRQYIELAQMKNGLAGFPISTRLEIFQVIAENLGKDFTLKDLDVLRKNTLDMMGLSPKEIALLKQLSYPGNSSRITPGEAALLEKWILIENALPAYSLMDFEQLASLHALIQDQSSPPLSPRSINNDQKVFEQIFEQKGIAAIPPNGVQMLQDMLEDRGDYIQGFQQLRPEQIRAGDTFLLAMLQFGQVPGLDPAQVGQLLELMQRRPEFQSQENMRRVLVMESIKNGFTLEQRQAFQALAANPRKPLSPGEVNLLKAYVALARQNGGLNGFSVQEKALLLFVVQNNLNSYFTPSDVAVLHRVDAQNMNVSMEALSKLSQKVPEEQGPSALQETEKVQEIPMPQMDQINEALQPGQNFPKMQPMPPRQNIQPQAPVFAPQPNPGAVRGS